MLLMRAKMKVAAVEQFEGSERLRLHAVCGSDPFGPAGESEDNTFARFTPTADLTMTINNPDLLGKIKPGQKFYIDFTEAE